MTFEEAFQLTPEERLRLEKAPWRGTDEGGWLAFAGAIQQQALKAYAEGEVTLERVLEVTLSCSLGCRPIDRAKLLAWSGKQALDSPPQRKAKHQPNPIWVRHSAATLLQMLIQDHQGEAFAPNDTNDWTTPILQEAIDWLVTLRLCERISPRTLYDWYQEAKKAGVLESMLETLPNSTSNA